MRRSGLCRGAVNVLGAAGEEGHPQAEGRESPQEPYRTHRRARAEGAGRAPPAPTTLVRPGCPQEGELPQATHKRVVRESFCPFAKQTELYGDLYLCFKNLLARLDSFLLFCFDTFLAHVFCCM